MWVVLYRGSGFSGLGSGVWGLGFRVGESLGFNCLQLRAWGALGCHGFFHKMFYRLSRGCIG